MIHFTRKAKLTPEIVAQLRRECPADPKQRGAWYREQGERYGVHFGTVRRACVGIHWNLRTWAIVDGRVVTIEGV